MRDPFDAVAFDAYTVTASPDGADVLLTCYHCPGINLGDYKPNPTSALAIVQTMRTHNLNCPARRPKPLPPTVDTER